MVDKELYERGIKCRGMCSICNKTSSCYQYAVDVKTRVIKFNGKVYPTIEEYGRAKHEYCYEQNKCPYYYGEGNSCMFGENKDDDKSLCKCNIETMFR